VDVLVLYNAPTLPPDDQDFASEAGVLESVEAVVFALSRAGHRVRQSPAGDSPAELLLKLEMGGDVDVIVNLCEGFGGLPAAEPHVAGLLELGGAAYTGSPPDCLSLARNKARTKWLLRGAGLPTAEFLLVGRGDSLDRRAAEELLQRGPAIVKPAAEDASLGLGSDSVVADLPALEQQVRAVHGRYGDALVEQFIAGREFNVGIVALPKPVALPLAEIEFQSDPSLRWPIVTYDAKWATGSGADRATPVRCPADVDAGLAARIQSIGLRAFQLTGCRDYARVDIRVDQAGQPFILEVNANPDLGPSAGLARAVRASGMDYDAFIARLVETARGRRPG
jgi:D-alanine-D-alanine ligase